MSENEVVDALLLPLADQFEAGISNRYVQIKPELCLDTYEVERGWLAYAVAEQWLVRLATDCYQFTAKGYLAFTPRIRALRMLPNT